jgi:hypothetical protein
MCVKIICTDHEYEFDPNMSLEHQIVGAKEILVSYDPLDPRIDHFVDQIERMIRSGVGCIADIRVNANNSISGFRLERRLEDLKRKMSINEVVKGLSTLHASTDSKLCEISKMCLEKTNE